MPTVSRQNSRNDSDSDSIASARSSLSYIRSSGIAPFPNYADHIASRSKQDNSSSDAIPKVEASGRSRPAIVVTTSAGHRLGLAEEIHVDALSSRDLRENYKDSTLKSNRYSNMDRSSRQENISYENFQSQELLMGNGSDHRHQQLARKPPQYSEAKEPVNDDIPEFKQASLGGGSLQQLQQGQHDLEDYAISKSEETTAAIYHVLKIAESTKEVATKTTIQVHHQGEQIRKTHETAVIVDMELKRGEKLLGSLGGLFSRKWRPKKNRAIKGPTINEGKEFKSKAFSLEQRAALGLKQPSNFKSKTRTTPVDDLPLNSRLEVEKAKQDDALSDLSNVVLQLKEMSLDIAHEFERQNEGIDHLHDDIAELNFRMQGANARGKKLLYS